MTSSGSRFVPKDKLKHTSAVWKATGLPHLPLFAIEILQSGHKTALWMHLDVCNDCCGWHASVFWTPILWTQ
ncbi:unnamed protein product [Pleuronectes platessa]|uniref:Uncharacterized protein n=1 Tax=Pleuronectes platessa TaxID=8262 RepID=A0A9N7UQV0_PLEPL|nr:unnamed protein product [Pleuronectes platessa]